MTDQTAENHENLENAVKFSPSDGFTTWLNEQKLSISFTTNQSSKLFFVGLKPNNTLSILERTFFRCLGLTAGVSSKTLFMSSLFQLWRFENILQNGQDYHGYDALYIPQVAYTTGDLDIHDIVVNRSNQAIFATTLFNCLAITNEVYNFAPLWKPQFITKITPEDRCHLNGIAALQGQIHYVSALGETDVPQQWRENRKSGGIIIDVSNNQILTRDLSLPHSPRLYQDRLWILNSGTGEFGTVDRQTGAFDPLCFCPGYLRGLAFHGDFAVLSLSKLRTENQQSLLPLAEKLKSQGIKDHCAIYVVDLRTGGIAHTLVLEGLIPEIYDLALLPGVRRPTALGLKTDEIISIISTGPGVGAS